MKLLSSVSLWRGVAFASLFLVLIVIFIQPATIDVDLRSTLPRVAVVGIIVSAVVILATSLLQPIRVRRSSVLPWFTAAVSGTLVAVAALLNVSGRAGSASSIFQGIRVVTGTENFGDLRIPLVWRWCSSSGYDVSRDLACTLELIASGDAQLMNYGPVLVWFPTLFPGPAATVPLGLAMIVMSSLSLVWVSKRATGLGQVTLLVAAFGACWFLLLERANLDALILWFSVAFAWMLARKDAWQTWAIAAVGVWILGALKYYPFALSPVLLLALRVKHGWIVVGAFSAATAAYVSTYWQSFEYAVLDQDQRSIAIGTGIGSDLIARSLSGVDDAPIWGYALVWVLVLAFATWGGLAAWRSSLVSEPLSIMGFLGALMVFVPLVWSGFGHQYKLALLMLAVPLLSRLRQSGDPAVWQSGLFGMASVGVALVGLWGYPLIWSIFAVLAASFSLAATSVMILRRCRPRP